jgi:hypothetical protein
MMKHALDNPLLVDHSTPEQRAAFDAFMDTPLTDEEMAALDHFLATGFWIDPPSHKGPLS